LTFRLLNHPAANGTDTPLPQEFLIIQAGKIAHYQAGVFPALIEKHHAHLLNLPHGKERKSA
jgi:hypothetical protein